MTVDRSFTAQSGAVAVIVAVMLPVLIGVAGLVIDGGALMLSRLRLQTAADASALAAASALGRSRLAGDPSTVPSLGRLETIAGTIAHHNWQTGAPLSLTVQTGRWDGATHRLVPTPQQPDAVSVRLGTTLPTHLAGVMGIRRWTLSASSTAILPSLGAIRPGAVTVPMSLVRSPRGAGPLSFAPENGGVGFGSCVAWLSFNPGGSAPALEAGQSQVQVLGSFQAQVFAEALQPPRAAPFAGEGPFLVPVIEVSRCPVPSGWYPVAGFATVTLRGAGPPVGRLVSLDHGRAPTAWLPVAGVPRSVIEVRVLHGRVASGRGSAGGDFGTLASSPVLVQ
ncbi:MAG: pilus assembly protein TadG-related protein [Nitrospira sp.]|nr:pilus assembly protein TadG-related protein [Nitrospira sp.]